MVRIRVGSLMAGLVSALVLLWAGPHAARPFFDLLQRLAPSGPRSQTVAVVTIDEESLRAVGGWPWSRYYLARLTERLRDSGARAIGFDMLFPEAERSGPSEVLGLYPELSSAARAELQSLQSMDQVFGRVIGSSPVVIARAGVTAAEADDRGDSIPPPARIEGPVAAAIPSYPGLLRSLEPFEISAAGLGLANGRSDDDGVVRRVPLLGRAAGALHPSLALELVRVAEGVEVIKLEGGGGALHSIRVGTRRVVTDAAGHVTLRFADTRIPSYPAVDVLREGLPRGAFQGRVVLVGLTAAATSDVVTTPRSPLTWGVYVQAQTVEAVLHGGGLKQLPLAQAGIWALALGAMAAALIGAAHYRLRWAVSLTLLTIVIAAGASALAFAWHVMLDPMPLALLPGTTSGAMTVLFQREGRRLQTRLRQALDAERLTAARVAGEMSAASEIQIGMLLPRSELARITPRAEVDAVLQPARTVGGDLYDVFMIDPERLCFLIGDVTGKGVPASLFMALAKAHARSFLMRPGVDLGEAVSGINAELSRDNGRHLFVTLLVGVLRLDDGQLELCRAGHDNAIVVDRTGSARDLHQPGGPPLCALDDMVYGSGLHQLELGDTLVVYTDGLTEAHSPTADLYGHPRALRTIEAAANAPTLPEMLDRIIADVRAFEGGQDATDDLAVLAVRRR